jgi:hypothetical protein
MKRLYNCRLQTCTHPAPIYKITEHNYFTNRDNEVADCQFKLNIYSGYRTTGPDVAFFCSETCLNTFKKYNCCMRCLEYYSPLIYYQDLGYSLCTSRGDLEISCIIKYNQFKQFEEEYKKNNTFYKICNISEREYIFYRSSLEEFHHLIIEHNECITIQMLYDLFYLYQLQEMNQTILIKDTNQCHDCHKKLEETFYCLFMFSDNILFKINCGCNMQRNTYCYLGFLGYDRLRHKPQDDYEVIKLYNPHYDEEEEEEDSETNGFDYILK